MNSRDAAQKSLRRPRTPVAVTWMCRPLGGAPPSIGTRSRQGCSRPGHDGRPSDLFRSRAGARHTAGGGLAINRRDSGYGCNACFHSPVQTGTPRTFVVRCCVIQPRRGSPDPSRDDEARRQRRRRRRTGGAAVGANIAASLLLAGARCGRRGFEEYVPTRRNRYVA